jgi:WD40 repeat protein
MSLLISGSQDRSIKIWDPPNDKFIRSINEAHDDTVYCLAFIQAGERLISGSSDMTIKVWEIASLSCLSVIKEHKDIISSLVVIENKIFSSSWDHSIKAIRI